MNSTLEITDKEFLIKLDRKKFNVSFVRGLLKMMEFTNPSEDIYSTPEWHYTPSQRNASEPDYFSSLDEK
ncbi:hypothetical protein [Mucilaginibacter lacusdianchii]|uniref:hypothetical protein n=1 Tax=Mucilaginibacter lacusdianchii TaxID=2684211 RepID=UPI00131BB051|nr:hypothetical protein [Mucilaginibacter sp. JXJ CY 39]